MRKKVTVPETLTNTELFNVLEGSRVAVRVTIADLAGVLNRAGIPKVDMPEAIAIIGDLELFVAKNGAACEILRSRVDRGSDDRAGVRPAKKPCNVKTCKKPIRTIGLCDMHYKRFIAAGRPQKSNWIREQGGQ